MARPSTLEKLRGSFGEGRRLDLVALALVLAVSLSAWREVRLLEWPCESDLYRDLGAAQSIVDGFAGTDPAFLGERSWYNPLVPAIVALESQVSGVSLHRAYTTFGAHLNVVSPLSFYVLAAVLFSRRVALASLTSFLFLGHLDQPSWLGATYSPWLWSCNLAQGFFYLALAASLVALRRQSRLFALGAGLASGLTLLAHTAPALVLGTSVAAVIGAALASSTSSSDRRATLVCAAILCGSGVVVSSPFWLPLVVQGATIRNPAPLEWLAGELAVDRWHHLLTREWAPRGVLAALGLASLVSFHRPPRPYATWAILAWLAAVVIGLAYGFARQLTPLPPLLPSWHFLFYLQAAISMLFGWGVASLLVLVSRATDDAIRARGVTQATLSLSKSVLAVVVLGALVASRWNAYEKRRDIVEYRRESKRFANEPILEVHRWALEHARPEEVFLAEPEVSFFTAAAGRKVVALNEIFSNPYVSVKRRGRDATTMLRALHDGDVRAFSKRAKEYSVKYVVLPAHDASTISPEFSGILRRTAVLSEHTIFRVVRGSEGSRAHGR
ncbi:MAG TPA: hypothetical protein VMS65_16235 [Polyangiaceae bacterium]|nr:hypothetical protein [Polyangiaceae bacterium]